MKAQRLILVALVLGLVVGGITANSSVASADEPPPTPTPSSPIEQNSLTVTTATTELQATASGRGYDPDDFTVSYYDFENLLGFLFSRPYTEPIDFYIECFSETYPYAGCELTPELTNGYRYSVRWQGTLITPADGAYTFRFANTDDGARLIIDGNEIADEGWYYPGPNLRFPPVTLSLSAGRHSFVVDYEQTALARAALQVRWAGPGFEDEVIPIYASLQEVVDYFALGDSIASGHGLMDGGAPCYNSTQAYPYKVADYLRTRYATVNFRQLACSGSTALSNDDPWLGKQLSNQVDAALAQMPSDHPVLVSITIGANDFSWTDPNNALRQFTKPASQFTGWADLTADLVSSFVYMQISELLQWPNVTVVVTEVHNPMNLSSRFFALRPVCNRLGCYERSEYVAHVLNTSLYANVQQAIGQPSRMLMTVALHQSFHGHESPSPSCGSSDISPGPTWIQEIGNAAYNSELPPNIEATFRLPSDSTGDCFHPNDLGAQAYANAVIAVLPALGH